MFFGAYRASWSALTVWSYIPLEVNNVPSLFNARDEEIELGIELSPTWAFVTWCGLLTLLM
ncbi:hypothetical protein D3C84_1273720 [compost metagenome]